MAQTTSAEEVIQTDYFRGQQDVKYVTVRKVSVGERLVTMRVTIRRDSYDDQSYGLLEVMDKEELRWNKIINKPIKLLRSLAVNPYDRNWGDKKDLFEKDAAAMIHEAVITLQ